MDTFADPLHVHKVAQVCLQMHKHTHAGSSAAATEFESLTAKHRRDLETDIVVACQEWQRQEAKSTVQLN